MITFDKNSWYNEFVSNKSTAPWRCSRCRTGSLHLVEKTLKRTKRLENTALLMCSNEECNSYHYVIGIQKHFAQGNEVGETYYQVQEYRIYPKHFQPELHLFELPIALPEEVKKKLIMSFNHFWYDYDACVNKLRQSLEILVDEKGGKGNQLHHKIESLKPTLGVDLSETLMAIKWIGNDGSHSGGDFTRDQILVTYSLVVDVLNKLYPDLKEYLKKRDFIKKANENKGIKNS